MSEKLKKIVFFWVFLGFSGLQSNSAISRLCTSGTNIEGG